MAIIQVAASDAIDRTVQFTIQPARVQPNTFVPRGVAIHNGTVAIPTLVAGNQTEFVLSLSFATNYTYLLKSMSIHYQADTVEATTFNNIAVGEFAVQFVESIRFEIISQGAVGVTSTLRSSKTWAPFGRFPRVFLDGSAPDSCRIRMEDPDAAADGQVAGDMFWNFEWYFFDQEQMRTFPVHTAAPVLSY